MWLFLNLWVDGKKIKKMKKYTKELFKQIFDKFEGTQNQFCKVEKMTHNQVKAYREGDTVIGFERACELSIKYSIDLNGLIQNKG